MGSTGNCTTQETEESSLLNGLKGERLRHASTGEEKRTWTMATSVLGGMAFMFVVATAVIMAATAPTIIFTSAEGNVYEHSRMNGNWDADEFKCDTCSMVFPSPLLVGKNLGAVIDGAECVIRFNGHRPMAQFYKDFGQKDNIRIGNTAAFFHIYEHTNSCVSSEVTKRALTFLDTHDFSNAMHRSLSAFARRCPEIDFMREVGDTKKSLMAFFKQHIGRVSRVVRPSTGFQAALYSVNFCNRVTIFGVPEENSIDDPWGLEVDSQKTVPIKGGKLLHDLPAEHRLLRNLHNFAPYGNINVFSATSSTDQAMDSEEWDS